MSGWRKGAVPIRDGALAYHRTGDGPALVLSHGLTDNGLCWSRLAAELSHDFDVIMLDARGHGESSRMRLGGEHDPAQDLAEAIEALGLESPIVMGHSVGGRATAAYANMHPDRVSKVVLEDPAFVPLVDGDVLAARRARFRRQVEDFHAMSEAQIMALGRATSPTWSSDDFPAWAAAKHQVDPEALPTFRTPWPREIDRITAPLLIVHGEPALGSLITPAIVEQARAANPKLQAVEIRGAGHNVRRENFTDFVAAVKALLCS